MGLPVEKIFNLVFFYIYIKTFGLFFNYWSFGADFGKMCFCREIHKGSYWENEWRSIKNRRRFHPNDLNQKYLPHKKKILLNLCLSQSELIIYQTLGQKIRTLDSGPQVRCMKNRLLKYWVWLINACVSKDRNSVSPIKNVVTQIFYWVAQHYKIFFKKTKFTISFSITHRGRCSHHSN